MKVVEETLVEVVEGPWRPEDVIRRVVDGGEQEDPFYVMDLGEVVARYQRWRELMPRVEPLYAVKCNDDRLLVATLAALGAGFDCASKAEIELVTSLGVEPERIIFANPAKMASHIRHASAAGVELMTFDSETELLKIKQIMPHAQLVLRIRCDAAAAQCPLGIKFGADPEREAPRLIKVAALLGLELMGISFHVGSGAGEVGAFARGLRAAAALADRAAALGLHVRLVDVGGGFAGARSADLRPVAQVINAAVEKYFPDRRIRVVAEPGRYFAAAAYTLATQIHATREVVDEAGGAHTMYFVNDGVYGSFNCVLYDHQLVSAEPLHESHGKSAPCSIWGPSCDGLDCVVPSGRLPALTAGQWLLWRDMGAYTLPVASPFNGFPVPAVRHVVDQRTWAVLSELPGVKSLTHAVRAPSPLPDSPPASPLPDSPPATPPASPPATPAPAPPRTVFVECALK